MIAEKKEETTNKSAGTLDMWMALHQRACWLITALLAVGGAAAVMLLLPREYNTYCAAGLAVGLMLLYRWASGAPGRTLKKVMPQAGAPQSIEQDRQALEYLTRLEKSLPAMRRNEMAYSLTCWRAVMLSRLGQREEALSLLRSFDRVWDPAQREQINALIQKIGGPNPPSPEKEPE